MKWLKMSTCPFTSRFWGTILCNCTVKAILQFGGQSSAIPILSQTPLGILGQPSCNKSLVGGFNHLEKYESQWEGLSHILWKIKVFETTNQITIESPLDPHFCLAKHQHFPQPSAELCLPVCMSRRYSKPAWDILSE